MEQEYTLFELRLSTIAQLINKTIIGDDLLINGLNLSNREILSSRVLSYCTSLKYLKIALENSKVKALVVSPSIYRELPDNVKNKYSYIIDEFPESTFYTLFMRLYELYYPHYSWKTDFNNAIILDGGIVEDGVILGKNVLIGNNSIIKSGTIIGNDVVIGACSVIGGDGFQLIKDSKGNNQTIPHAGRVKIGNYVSIGDNVTISKSLFDGFTHIGDYTKIDNHVHVAHNCKVGENCVLAANCIMFGSSELKRHVWVAPNATIMNRVVVEDDAFIGASSFVSRNVKSGARMFGIPAININE